MMPPNTLMPTLGNHFIIQKIRLIIWLDGHPQDSALTTALELENLIAEHLSIGGLLVLTSHQAVNIANVKVLDL